MSLATTGAMLGLLGGAGVALAVSRLPMRRRPSIEDRVGPYLRDPSRPSRLLAEQQVRTPFPTLERIAAPLITDAVRLLDRWVGGTASVRRRLDMLGGRMTLEQFRAEQLLWAGIGLAAGLGAAVLLQARGGGHPAALALVVLACAVVGLLAPDRRLTRDVQDREQRILLEFPTIAELLALSVARGKALVEHSSESPRAAQVRCRRSSVARWPMCVLERHSWWPWSGSLSAPPSRTSAGSSTGSSSRSSGARLSRMYCVPKQWMCAKRGDVGSSSQAVDGRSR